VWGVATALLLTASLAACRGQEATIASGEDGMQVAPVFAEFWRQGGGAETFGPPITPAQESSAGIRQTFLAVEMVETKESGKPTVRLAPLGLELGLAEPPVPPPSDPSQDYFSETGHTLYPGFAPLYAEVGGVEVVGPPITEVAFRNGEIVQYFENAGIVRPENASPAETRLVSLGLSARPPSGTFGLDTDSLVLGGVVRQRPFEDFLAPLGGELLFGQPLTDPYLAADGSLEQVYERAVVYSPDGSPRHAAFRTLGAALGPPQEPALPSSESGARYFKSTGHNVLWAFADFYDAKDGDTILGDPLEEPTLHSNRISQRFENGVLEYRFDLPPDLAVQLAPLGRDYLKDHAVPTSEASPAPPSEPTAAPQEGDRPSGLLQVRAQVARPILGPGVEQEMTVEVKDARGKPARGAEVTVTLLGPDGERAIDFPATDRSGKSTGSWSDNGPAGRIVGVRVEVHSKDAAGEAALVYALGLPSNR
jgi:hypothetical protein